jgi:hypothetical protein
LNQRPGREARLVQFVRSPRARIAALVAGLALVTLATCLVAYPRMFFGFAFYDDEGYLLISLESFLDQGSLYDEVFSQYGPFYYELWGGIFSLVGAPVSHDNGRMATLLMWILTSLAVGVSTYRITRSVLLGLSAQMLAFATLESLTREPMLAGGLTCVLVALVLLTSTFVRGRAAKPAMSLLGAAIAAVLLVKVNVGVFALAALALTCSVSYSVMARTWVRVAVAAGFVLIPAVLMAGQFVEPWVQDFCLHVTVAAVPVALLLNGQGWRSFRDPAELRWLAAGLLGTAFAICFVAVVSGTSAGGLVEGVIGRPLGQADRFSVPYEPSAAVAVADLAAVAGFVVYLYLARSGRLEGSTPWHALVSAGSVAVGVEIALSVVGRPLLVQASESDFGGYQLGLLAYAWVALIRLPGVRERRGQELALRLLPPLAVLQALHAYPVAGSQIPWATFLLVPVGAVCMANGARGLARAADGLRPAARRRLAAVGTVAALALFLFVADTTLRRELNDARADFNEGIALGLPGAEEMRVPPDEARRYREIARALRGDCGTFLSMPGLNSFYLWTGREPPTALNATHWMNLLSEGEQRRVIEAVSSEPRLCALRQPRITAFWARGGRLPSGPLVRFIDEGFDPIARFGGYELSRRVGGGDLR